MWVADPKCRSAQCQRTANTLVGFTGRKRKTASATTMFVFRSNTIRYDTGGLAITAHWLRAIELTKEGRTFHEQLTPLLGALQEACDATSRKPAIHSLSVHCAPSFAVKCLAPRLSAFLNAQPEISVRMSTVVELPALTGTAEVDLAIVYGTAPVQAGIRCDALGRERIAPMRSPKMAREIVDLGTQISSCVLIESPLSPVKWSDWCIWNKLEAVPVPRLSMVCTALAIASAVDGLGIALESTVLAARELVNGELLELRSPGNSSIERELHFLCYREGGLKNPPVATFREWLFSSCR